MPGKVFLCVRAASFFLKIIVRLITVALSEKEYINFLEPVVTFFHFRRKKKKLINFLQILIYAKQK